MNSSPASAGGRQATWAVRAVGHAERPTRLRDLITTKNVDRLDLFVNTRPQRSLDVSDGTVSLDVPPLAGASSTIELRGFRKDQLVASTRVRL